MQLCASRTVLTALCLSSLFAASLRAVSAEESAAPKPTAEWYFWNEITGETQWEDPGDVPYEEEGAVRHASGVPFLCRGPVRQAPRPWILAMTSHPLRRHADPAVKHFAQETEIPLVAPKSCGSMCHRSRHAAADTAARCVHCGGWQYVASGTQHVKAHCLQHGMPDTVEGGRQEFVLFGQCLARVARVRPSHGISRPPGPVHLTCRVSVMQVLAVADRRAAGLRPQRAQVLVGGELERGAQTAVLLQPEDEGVHMVRTAFHRRVRCADDNGMQR